jgi:ERCC4-type nuclease
VKPGYLYIDTSVGSREFEPLLARLGAKPILVPRLPADFALLGCGRDGKEWRIGVERKTLSDLGSSLLMDRLFGTQLPRMLQEYDRVWLIVEGLWRCGDDDCIEVWGWDPRTKRQGWVASRVPLSWSQLQGWMMSYDEAVSEWKGPSGVVGHGRRWRTGTEKETARWLAALLRWWNKPYHRHNGHIAIELDRPMPGKVHAMIHRPNQVQKTAFSLPELGAKTALKVGRHFKTVLEMIEAEREEWRAAGVGRKDADTVYRAIRGL